MAQTRARGAAARNALTGRQRQILELLAAGRDYPNIARELGITVGAVKAVLSRVRRRLGLPAGAPLGSVSAIYELVGRPRLDPKLLHYLFEKAPLAIMVTRGPEHVVELANDMFRSLAPGRDVVGMRIRDVFTATQEQPFVALIERIYATGERQVSSEIAARSDFGRLGIMEKRFFSFVAEPIRVRGGHVEGVIGFFFDVSDSARERQRTVPSSERSGVAGARRVDCGAHRTARRVQRAR